MVNELEVTCWCEAYTVAVPREEVMRGLTRSCRRAQCVMLGLQNGGFVPRGRMYETTQSRAGLGMPKL
jgi:hypothetical protein